ncbi:rubredoxin [Persephonella sp.]
MEKLVSTEKRKCRICGYVYDPKKGDLLRNIPPYVPFENLPENWRCPVCKYSKAHFFIIKNWME